MKKLSRSTRQVYFNGKFVPESEAKISIYDSALMFGDMVFEMTRSFANVQFKLEEHITRLYDGCKILRIPLSMSKQEMYDACLETVEINSKHFGKEDEHRLMIDVSRGILSTYRGVDGLEDGVNVIIADFPLRWTVSSMGVLFDKGINVVITSQRTVPSMYIDPKIKNRSRIAYLNANIEVSSYPGDNNWALLLDSDGFVAEGTGCNFFIVKEGRILTPVGRNILRGISRDYIMNEICPSLMIPVKEQNIEPYDVYTADEAFVSATPFCILPVTSINGIQIGNGCVGNVYKSLLNEWSKNVGVDIKGQIQKWDADLHQSSTGINPYKFK